MNNLKAERTLTAEELLRALKMARDAFTGLSDELPHVYAVRAALAKAERIKPYDGVLDERLLTILNRLGEDRNAEGDDRRVEMLVPEVRSMIFELQALRSQSLSTQQPMGEVRVKALEWVEVTSPREDGPPEPIGEYVAETPFGSYYIDMYFGTDSYGWSANFEASDIDGSDSDSPEKAKAAAQADYESGIRSALHPNQESGE